MCSLHCVCVCVFKCVFVFTGSIFSHRCCFIGINIFPIPSKFKHLNGIYSRAVTQLDHIILDSIYSILLYIPRKKINKNCWITIALSMYIYTLSNICFVRNFSYTYAYIPSAMTRMVDVFTCFIVSSFLALLLFSCFLSFRFVPFHQWAHLLVAATFSSEAAQTYKDNIHARTHKIFWHANSILFWFIIFGQSFMQHLFSFFV